MLDRLLALWILLAVTIGILLGNFVDSVGLALQKGKFVNVSVPFSIGLLVMMHTIVYIIKDEKLQYAFLERAMWVRVGFQCWHKLTRGSVDHGKCAGLGEPRDRHSA